MLSVMPNQTATERVSLEVKVLMVRGGHTVESLADAAGLSAPSLYRRLRGEVDWTVGDLDAVATVFGVPVMSLLSEPMAS